MRKRQSMMNNGLVTLFFFLWFALATGFVSGQEENQKRFIRAKSKIEAKSGKAEPQTQGVIEKKTILEKEQKAPTAAAKKKKFPSLVVLAGALAASVIIYLLVAKKKQKNSVSSEYPLLGAHAIAFQFFNTTNDPLATPEIITQTSGSTIVISIGRGNSSGFSNLPTDNMGNSPYVQIGSVHEYTNWPGSGTALYAFQHIAGGGGHVFTAMHPPGDETTMAVVEVMNSGVIQDFKWNEVLRANPKTSLSVTTTGPATLIAFWWGDAYAGDYQTTTPNNGFQFIDGALEPGNMVQCAVAAKNVSAAGTYNVTWTSIPDQGAQLWLVAVQKLP